MTVLALLLLQAPGPTLEVEVGYSGMAFRDSWTRITVEILNEADPVEGILHIHVLGYDVLPMVHRREVRLSRGANKRFAWDVFLSGNEHEIRVDLTDGAGERIVSGMASVRFLPDRERQVVVAGRTPGSLRALEETLGLAVAWAAPEWIPDHVASLLAADVIIFPEPVRLEPHQEEALLQWVDAGGRLVFSPGRLMTTRLEGIWGEVCPVEVTGLTTVEVGERSITLATAEGASFFSIGRRPAAYRRGRGRGEVVFLAFPLDLDGLVPAAPLWRSVFAIKEPDEELEDLYPRARRGASYVGTQSIIRQFGLGGVSPNLPLLGAEALLLCLYAALIGPLGYRFLKRKGRLRKGWRLFGATVAVFGALMLVGSVTLSPREGRTRHIVFIDDGLVQSFTTMRFPFGGHYDVETTGRFSPLTALGYFSNAGEFPPTVIDGSGKASVPARAMEMRTFLSCRVGLPEEVGVVCQWEDRGARRLEVENLGKLRLLRCFVILRGSVYELEGVGPGEVRSFALGTVRPEPLEDWMDRMTSTDHVDMRWMWRPRWEDVPAEGKPIELTLWERFRRGGRRTPFRYLLTQRKVDLTPMLDQGRAIFLAPFGDNVSGVAAPFPGEVETLGLLRTMVR